MATQIIRKSGNASIVSIPKKFLELLGLDVGDEIDIDVKDKQITIKPHKIETLESLLANSDKESFKVLDEDRDWLDAKPKGMEI